MADYIKMKYILIISILVMLLMAFISSLAVGRTTHEKYIKIRQELSMCNFYTSKPRLKEICINKIKKKYKLDNIDEYLN